VIRAMGRSAVLLAIVLLGIGALALVPSARGAGPTPVSGDVSGSWTLEGSPYLVTADATVGPASTLDIGPGVEVRFSGGTHLFVAGELVVRGAGLTPVSFTSADFAVAGAWGGIVVTGRVTLQSASITYATWAFDLEGGTALVDGLVASQSRIGLRVSGAAASVTRSAFSMNEVAGVSVTSGTADLARVELATNAWALALSGATVTIDNGTITGSVLGDADLTASRLLLRNSTRTGAFQFHDAASTATESWYAHALVKDAFGTPVPSASVTVEGGGLPAPIQRVTDPDGRARWIELVGRVSKAAGTSVPVYTVTASSRGASAGQSLSLFRETELVLGLPADVTDPVAAAGPNRSVPEDRAVTFDAGGSTDNDPAFPAGASFAWRFDDGVPVVLRGATVTYTFATPGRYTVVLDVTDAAGNLGQDVSRVTVQDTTAPAAAMQVPAQAYAGESVALDARLSTDNDPGFPATGNFTWTIESGGTSRTVYGRTAAFSGWWGRGTYTVTLRVRDAGGNDDAETATLEIVDRPFPNFLWLAAALAAWFAALGIAGTERGRMAFITWLVLPLFTRMRKDEVLDQFTRGQIYGYIVVHPGDSYVDIKRNLQLNNGTLTHHLNVLERDALIRSKNVGTRKLFFAAGARVPEDGGGMHEVQQQILRHLRESGGLAVNDVAGVIGISRQLAIYHLRDLSRRGLVRIERRAFRIVAYAEEPQGPAFP